jgi:hypothetical protein
VVPCFVMACRKASRRNDAYRPSRRTHSLPASLCLDRVKFSTSLGWTSFRLMSLRIRDLSARSVRGCTKLLHANANSTRRSPCGARFDLRSILLRLICLRPGATLALRDYIIYFNPEGRLICRRRNVCAKGESRASKQTQGPQAKIINTAAAKAENLPRASFSRTGTQSRYCIVEKIGS